MVPPIALIANRIKPDQSMPHALLLTLLFATSLAAEPSTPADKTQPRDEDAQDRTLKMAVLSGATACGRQKTCHGIP